MDAAAALLGVVLGVVLTYASQGAAQRRAEAVALRLGVAEGRRLIFANHSSRAELSVHYRGLHLRISELTVAGKAGAEGAAALTATLWKLADKCWYSSLQRLRTAEADHPGQEPVRLPASPDEDLLRSYGQCESLVDGLLSRISRRPAATAIRRRGTVGGIDVPAWNRHWTETLDRHGGASPDVADALTGPLGAPPRSGPLPSAVA